MIEPKYLKTNGTIGIVAPSDGINNEKGKESCLKAEKKLINMGYKITYSTSCFNSQNGRSADAITRAKEFSKLYFNKKVDILIAISGGEYEMEIIKYLPLRKMKKYPKLFCGYSDNSILTFIMLTNLEMINIYGHNLYELSHNHEVIDNYLDAIKGKFHSLTELKKVSEKDYDFINDKINDDYNLDCDASWKVFGDLKINTTGILIGGLLDDLICICGTKYDKVRNFTKKYKDSGFIWYLDICTMSPESVKRALFQLKNSGWFRYAKAILVGRPIFKYDAFGTSYIDNMYDELKDLNIPIIFDFDVSHIPPSYHLINGKKVKLVYENELGKINYLKEEI